MRLAGKVVLVTGSATGIGEGIARRAASEGATVVLHGREEERQSGEALGHALCAKFLAGDLIDPETPRRLIAETVERFGRLDGLVNNAGVSWRGNIDAPAELFDAIMAVNARAPFLMIQAARPFLKGGSVVNIGSVNAHRGGADLVPYAMSKAALSNMTRSLAAPLAKDGIRINALNLGWTATPNERRLLMETAGWAEDWPETKGGQMPFGRLLSAEDVASSVVHLLSDEARMISGQVWDLDQRAHGG